MRFISTRANILKIIYFLLILVGLPAFGLQVALAQDDKGSLTIGSGGVTGVYYPVAGAICRLFNDSQDAKRSRCSAVSTGGSVDNLTRLRRGELSFGVVQSDWQFHAIKGTAVFEDDGADPNLRSVVSLYPEAFTVLARADAGIERFEDLRGKRVNIGNPGSGQHGTMQVVMAAYGWTRGDFSLVREFKSSIQSRALCPSGSIKQATTECDVVLVEVSGPNIDALIAEHDYYRRATVPSNMYRGTEREIMTFGVGATLVTAANTSEEVVYALVKSLYDNFDRFKGMHPALASLRPHEMPKDGLSAELHEGARRYYRERGLL
jgi:TRAP transporter TAXI family solute receptor